MDVHVICVRNTDKDIWLVQKLPQLSALKAKPANCTSTGWNPTWDSHPWENNRKTTPCTEQKLQEKATWCTFQTYRKHDNHTVLLSTTHLCALLIHCLMYRLEVNTPVCTVDALSNVHVRRQLIHEIVLAKIKGAWKNQLNMHQHWLKNCSNAALIQRHTCCKSTSCMKNAIYACNKVFIIEILVLSFLMVDSCASKTACHIAFGWT